MRKKLQSIILSSFFILFNITVYSQYSQYSVSVSIPGPYFIQGVSISNTITASTSNMSVIGIDFLLASGSNSYTYSINGTNATWIYDFGNISAGQYTLYVGFYDVNNYLYIDSSNTFTVIPQPQWLTNSNGFSGAITSVTANNNILSMNGNFDLTSVNENIPNIPGLKGKNFNIDPKLTFTVNFDCGTANSTVVTTPEIETDINILNQFTHTYNYPLSGNIQLQFDQNFNPSASINGTYTTPPIQVKWPLFRYPLPAAPFVQLKVNGGLNLSAELKGKLSCTSNPSWQLDTISGAVKVYGEGVLSAELDALVASIEGKLVGTATLGVGSVYSTYNNSLTPFFGGNVSVDGEINYKVRFLTQGSYTGNIYSNQFGDNLNQSPFVKLMYQNKDVFGNHFQLLQSNGLLNTPNFFASPYLAGRDTNLYVIWLDTNQNNQTVLYFSKYNFNSNSFNTPMEVFKGDVGISNPRLTILPQGDAIISWVQTRYHFNNTAADSIEDLLESQDIWVSLYNASSQSFSSPQMLNDDTSSDESGRAEGNQNLFWGKGNKGIITWTSSDDQFTESDVYYSIIEKTGPGNFTLSSPDYLINLPGKAKSVNISFIDSLYAIATWIHDIDGIDTTFNQEILYSEIDLSAPTPTWTNPAALLSYTSFTNPVEFNDLTMDFNEKYGGLAFTVTQYNASLDTFTNYLYATYYIPNTQTFSPWSGVQSNTLNFLKPTISVNDSGIVTLLYQTISVYDNVNNPDDGQINLYVVDTKSTNPTWNTFNNTPYLNEPGTYVWDVTTSYGKTNDFFVLTHEANASGNAPSNPQYGTRFGNNYLNLVLRKLSVSSNTLASVEQPDTKHTINENILDVQLYPNPNGGNFTLYFNASVSEWLNIQITDLSGKLILELFNQKINPGEYHFKSNIVSLENGIYLCKVKYGNKLSVKKLVIQK